MPVYEYQCEKCKHSFEKLVFKGDKERINCPTCGDMKVKNSSFAPLILSYVNTVQQAGKIF